jgi:hypothetical protein
MNAVPPASTAAAPATNFTPAAAAQFKTAPMTSDKESKVHMKHTRVS